MIHKGSTKIDDIWCTRGDNQVQCISSKYAHQLLHTNYIIKSGNSLYLRYNNGIVEGLNSSRFIMDSPRWVAARGWIKYLEGAPTHIDSQKVYKVINPETIVEATDEELHDALSGDLLELGAFND